MPERTQSHKVRVNINIYTTYLFFRLKLSWYDSRLSFINLKDDQYKNWVTQVLYRYILDSDLFLQLSKKNGVKGSY